MKAWLRTSLILLPFLLAIGFFAYTSIDVWFLDEEAPESFAVATPDCVEGEPCGMYDWQPYCEYGEDQYGVYSQCYDYEGGEPLCIYADGPYHNDWGEPYFNAEWDYCAALEWGDPDAVTIPIIDYEVDSKVVGATTTGAVPLIGKFAISAVTGKGKMKRAIKEALKEQMNGH